jgi:hypothetical protein
VSYQKWYGDTPLHVGAAIVGAGINVFNNWDKIVRNPWSALGYIGTGAVAGVASLAPGGALAAAKITAAGNFATDLVTGGIPDINSVQDAFGYMANSAMNALDVAGAGKIAKAGFNGLGKLGIEWANQSVEATGQWVFSDITSKGVSSTVDNIAFGTVITDYKMEWVVNVGMGPFGFGSAGKAMGVANTPPTLPDKTIVNQDGVKIEHNYRSGDHGYAHAHVKGGGPETKIGPKGHPFKGFPEMTTKQRSVYEANRSTVRKSRNKIGKYLKYIGK